MALYEVVSDNNHVEGARRIGSVWRMYLRNPACKYENIY